jgi:hypothetical protein
VNSWKVILATMVIFGTGVITGGLLVKMTSAPARNRPVRNVAVATNAPMSSMAPAQMLRLEFLMRVRKELELSAEQNERIEKIIREGQERSRKLWEGVAPELRTELQSVHARIRAELSPEQRRRFEQLLRNASRPNQPEGGQPPNPERLRERQRQGERLPDGTVRPARRDGPPVGPRPEGEPGFPPPENPPPSEPMPVPPADGPTPPAEGTR